MGARKPGANGKAEQERRGAWEGDAGSQLLEAAIDQAGVEQVESEDDTAGEPIAVASGDGAQAIAPAHLRLAALEERGMEYILGARERSLARELYDSRETPGEHKTIKGVDQIDKVIRIDQSPIGRTPRANPAKGFTSFASTPVSMKRAPPTVAA